MSDNTLFEVPFKETKLIGEIVPAGIRPHVLCLHGAGQSTRRRYQSWLVEALLEVGIGCCIFDMIGHGDTAGELGATTLKERTDQAVAVIDELQLAKPLIVIGSSMGAYNALKLTELYPVAALVLVVPAVYAEEAYTVPFGIGFTEILRRPHSWEESDAWEILARFTGRLLIMAAEHDEVIPAGLIDRLYGSADKASQRTIHTTSGAGHAIISYLHTQPQQMTEFQDTIVNFVRKAKSDL